MDTRLGILSVAAFAGVVLGGLVVADPGVAGALNPVAAVSGLFGQGEEHEYEGGGQEAGRTSDASFVSDAHEGHDDHDDHEDDD